MPSRYCKDCQLKEISTIRKTSKPKDGQNDGNIKTCVIFGRSVGRIMKQQSVKNISLEDNQNQKSNATSSNQMIKLVRLMFYLPKISKETDVSFQLDEVIRSIRVSFKLSIT